MLDNQTPEKSDRRAAIELHAYNAAFHELGLTSHWDPNLYRTLEQQVLMSSASFSTSRDINDIFYHV